MNEETRSHHSFRACRYLWAAPPCLLPPNERILPSQTIHSRSIRYTMQLEATSCSFSEESTTSSFATGVSSSSF